MCVACRTRPRGDMPQILRNIPHQGMFRGRHGGAIEGRPSCAHACLYKVGLQNSTISSSCGHATQLGLGERMAIVTRNPCLAPMLA
eukprot:10804332-Lingulodinium_polyedra.AAC.1